MRWVTESPASRLLQVDGIVSTVGWRWFDQMSRGLSWGRTFASARRDAARTTLVCSAERFPPMPASGNTLSRMDCAYVKRLHRFL